MSDYETVTGTNAAYVVDPFDVFGLPYYDPPLAGSTEGVPQPSGAVASPGGDMGAVNNHAAGIGGRGASNHPLLFSTVLIAIGFVVLAVAADMNSG